MDPYKELGVSPSATDDEIKTAYRNLVKKYHPDRYANAPKDVQDQVSEKVKRINTAYDEIKKMRAGGGTQQQGYGYGYGNPYGNAYGGYSSQQGTGTSYASSEQFQDIREMIQRGLIMQAAEALNRIQNRTAEWHYLTGLVYMRQGMYSRAQQSFQQAAAMEPNNAEYRQAAEQMSGVYQQTHTRTMGGANSLLCNLCQCLACMSFCGGGNFFFCC